MAIFNEEYTLLKTDYKDDEGLNKLNKRVNDHLKKHGSMDGFSLTPDETEALHKSKHVKRQEIDFNDL